MRIICLVFCREALNKSIGPVFGERTEDRAALPPMSGRRAGVHPGKRERASCSANSSCFKINDLRHSFWRHIPVPRNTLT